MNLQKLTAGLLASFVTTTLTAQIDRESAALVDYQHLRHATLAEIQAWSAQGYRLSNFEIHTTQPELQLDCSLVRNTGVYAAGWLFYHDKTRAELLNLCSQNNARIVDLERYLDNGEERLSALLFVNSGAQQKAWHWFTSVPQGSVYSTVNNIGDRIIDIEPYQENGQQYYHVISIPNSGPDHKPWWVYTNTTSTNVQNHIAQFGSRVYDYELESILPASACCVLVQDDLKSLTLWGNFYGSGFADDVENGGRVIGLGRQGLSGRVVTMLNNKNPFTSSGIACAGTMGMTSHTGEGTALTGTQVVYRGLNLRPWAPTFMVYGFAPQSLSLTLMGAPGCWGYLVPVATELRFANGSGIATDTLNIPANPSLAGLPLLTQILASDPGNNPLGMQTSRRLQTLIRHW